MIARPAVVVKAERSPKWQIATSLRIDERTAADLERTIRFFSERSPLRVSIENMPLQHVGLGSKTSLLLAVIAAISNELDLRLSPQEMQALSGRGGTSGIGIHGFFSGGFLVDAGHPQHAVGSLLPSAASPPQRPPELNLRLEIPPNWRFHLLLPPGPVREGSSEIEFFRQNTPIPESEVFEAISLVYHNLVPGIRQSDLQIVGTTLRRIHEIGFKKSELASQSEAVRNSYDMIQLITSAPLGLSSMGPLLYIIGDANDSPLESSILASIHEVVSSYSCAYLGCFPGCNRGYSISA